MDRRRLQPDPGSNVHSHVFGITAGTSRPDLEIPATDDVSQGGRTGHVAMENLILPRSDIGYLENGRRSMRPVHPAVFAFESSKVDLHVPDEQSVVR